MSARASVCGGVLSAAIWIVATTATAGPMSPTPWHRPVASPLTSLLASSAGDAPAAGQTGEASASAPRGPSPRLKAMLLSALLPGLGQYVYGHHGSGYLFMGTEAAIWGAYVGFKLQGDSRQERYEDFAERWGGVENAREQSDTYYSDLGKYESFDDYRVIAIRTEEGEIYGPEQHWTWPSIERRRRYRDLLAQADNSDQNAEFMLSAALLNRAIAVVHAARSVRSSKPPKLSLRVDPDEGALVPMLVWKSRF